MELVGKHLLIIILCTGLMTKAEVTLPLNQFSVSIYEQIASKHLGPSENAVFSPFSMAAALSMVHAGARGQTAQQIKSGLYLTDMENDQMYSEIGNALRKVKGEGNSYSLETANQVYVEQKFPLKEEFQTILREQYESPSPKSVDFGLDSTRLQINRNVEDLTQKKIKDLLPPNSLTTDTKLVLINAIYFKGQWENKFKRSKNRDDVPFYLGSKNKNINVTMMSNIARYLSGPIDTLEAKFLELPYVGNEVSMFIILPNEVDGLLKIESKMKPNIIDDILAKWKNAGDDNKSQYVRVEIPKFKIESNIKMKTQLEDFGIKDMFSESKADFSGISEKSDGLAVSDVFHKAFLEVNEEGTEAAAATAVEFSSRSGEPSPKENFKVDRPSLWLLRHNPTGLWLFIGRLMQPGSDETVHTRSNLPTTPPPEQSTPDVRSSTIVSKSAFYLYLVPIILIIKQLV